MKSLDLKLFNKIFGFIIVVDFILRTICTNRYYNSIIKGI